ncbi:MAG: hypothetical protein WCQ96_03725 [Patescibacteria group bacterium]
MLNWINFLHLYQPPRQNEYIFHKVARESYFEIAKFFDRYDGLNLTMNISGSLLEQLVEYQYDKLLEDFRRAFASGEMELAGSAMYHPILPLLPESEIERQILLDENIKKQIFGSEYSRQGFYLPEMAYSKKTAEVLDKMGFKWIILDEISYSGKLGSFDKEKVYKIKGLNIKVIFRDRDISNRFVPEKIKEISDGAGGNDLNIITATDGELYGHRHRDFYEKTRAAFEDGNIKSLKVSDFIKAFGEEDPEEVEPVVSNWESTEDELANNIPFSYWDLPENEIQKKLRSFADFVIEELAGYKNDEKYDIARELLDMALSSCHLWAASGKKSAVWEDVIWNPDIIESGNLLLVQSVRSIVRMNTQKRMEAENRYLEIERLIWSEHWNKFYRP